ncbi:iron ABC transporter permease [Mycoplasmatota bacterium WC30]
MKILNYLKRNIFYVSFLVFVTWAVITFLIYPNINIIFNAFRVDNKFSFEALTLIMNSERAMKGLRNSILLAITLSITVNIIGVFIILVTEYFDIKGSKILRLGYMTTLIYGGIVLVSGYVFVYGDNGMFTKMMTTIFPSYEASWFKGYLGVVFVMTFSVTSNHMIFLRNVMKKIDFYSIEASKNLGASTFKTLWKVVLPIMKPTIFAVTILVFLTGLGAFSAPLLVGGREFETINPLIRALIYDAPDISIMLSVILGLLVIGLLILFTKLESGGTYFSTSKTKGEFKKQKIDNKFVNVIVHIFAYAIFLIYVLPIVIIVLFSFTDAATIASGSITWSSFTFANYTEILSNNQILKPFFNSINFSIIAAVIVVFFVFFIVMLKFKRKNKVTKAIPYLLLIPWLLPSTVIAMGLITTYNTENILVLGNVLIGTTFILIVGYVIVKIPFTYRLLNAIYYTVDNSYENASKSLGANNVYTFFRVTLPMVLPTVVALIVINFNSLIKDYNLTVFLYHPLNKTLGIDIKNKTDLMAGGDVQTILLIYTVMLMAFSAFAIYIAYGKLLKRKD